MPTTKKSSPKKSTTKKTVITAPEKKSAELNKGFKKIFTKRNIILGVILVLFVLGTLLYVFKGLFVAATVNGHVITRMELNSELERKAGKSTLETIITKKMIFSEMKKKNITVSDAEVKTEIQKIEKSLTQQGRNLDEALSQQQPPLTRADLEDQIRIQKMIERLFSKEATVSAKEIDLYIEQNKELLPEGQDEKSLRASVVNQLREQKLTGKFQEWLSNLQKSAKVNYFVSF